MIELLDLNWDVFVTPGIPTVTSDPPPGHDTEGRPFGRVVLTI
jgi:hypothetical protein